MTRFLLYGCFFFVCVYTVISSQEASNLKEWSDMVMNKVKEIRNSRSIPDDTGIPIVNIQEHYFNAFRAVNNKANIQTNPFYQSFDEEEAIEGRYIVLLQSDTSQLHLYETIAILQNAHERSSGKLVARHIEPIKTIAKGFTATLGQRVVNVLREHPLLCTIEQDKALKRNTHRYSSDFAVSFESDNAIPWNLDRIDQHTRPLDGEFSPKGTGEGVDVYILDTGIRYSHEEFEGRAYYCGYDAIDELVGTQERGNDCNGHGSHCAGTVGGNRFGVAKKATLYAARVLDCTGTGAVSGIIRTMEYIVDKRVREQHTTKAVFSMSLGVTKSDVFNEAVNNTVLQGIVVVSASGNQGQDSCNYSPGSAELAISVAATDTEDRSVTFSNIGECVDIFAPGVSIESAMHTCDTCSESKTGTSMAAPHVAGYAAVMFGIDPSLSPEQLKEMLVYQSTKDSIGLARMTSILTRDTPNRLLYVP